jgi:hypothetical protein
MTLFDSLALIMAFLAGFFSGSIALLYIEWFWLRTRIKKFLADLEIKTKMK